MGYKTNFEKKLIASNDGIATQYYRITLTFEDYSMRCYFTEYFTDVIVLAQLFFNNPINPIEKVIDFHVELLNID